MATKAKKPAAKLATKKKVAMTVAAVSPEITEEVMVNSVKLLHPIKHDGKRIPAGAVIELPDEAATSLVDTGIADWVDAEADQSQEQSPESEGKG